MRSSTGASDDPPNPFRNPRPSHDRLAATYSMVHVMSEVKRYAIYSGAKWEAVAVKVGPWVKWRDFDTQRLRADTAERGLANCKLALDAQTHNYGVTNLRLIAAELRADTAEAELKELEAAVVWALPGTRFMDPPDGGSPTLGEQVGRMAEALAAAEQRIASHESMLRHFANCSEIRRVGTAAMDYVAALNPEAESHE